ncbi:MAG: VWA domain-containing protein [Streptococcaceae bacterium]|jgi:hypothetical protein|nr:VWA domain-containing protein [Streptococcaceae bacterium]
MLKKLTLTLMMFTFFSFGMHTQANILDEQMDNPLQEIIEPELPKQRILFKDEKEHSKQYTILLIDSSYPTRGPTIKESQKIFTRFIKDAISSKQDHELAVISYNDEGYILQHFTDDYAELTTSIASITTKGKTNLTDALLMSDTLFSPLPTNAQKNILLITDRMPSQGNKSKNGRYTAQDFYNYQLANAADNFAQKLKSEDVTFRTFVYMNKISDTTKELTKRFYQNLQTHGFYALDSRSTENIDFIFNAKENGDEFISGSFSYGQSVEIDGKKRDAQSNFYYSDNYFEEDAYAHQTGVEPFNPSFATMSLNLQFSSWASKSEKDYAKKSKNSQDLFEKIGFEHFQTNEGFQTKPTKDSIGVVVAQKKINLVDEEYTVVALSVRGGGYEAEWASNLTLGMKGEHAGFKNASRQVLTFLEQYLKNTKVSGKMKLWLTGFSRGGAVANLAGGAINQGQMTFPENIQFEPKNMYVFCFEPPAGTLIEFQPKTAIHNNILNIINPYDIVTKVAPSVEPFGFVTYGRNYELPVKEKMTEAQYNYLRDKMYNQYLQLETSKIYQIDSFQMKKIRFANGRIVEKIFIVDDVDSGFNLLNFVDEIVSDITLNVFENRQEYADNFEGNLRELMSILNDSNDSINFSSFFEVVLDNLNKAIAEKITNGFQLTNNVLELLDIENIILKSAEELFADYKLSNKTMVIQTLTKLTFKTLVKNDLNMLLTLLFNKEIILQAHSPELCLSWLRSKDVNYLKSPTLFPDNDGILKRTMLFEEEIVDE